MGLVCCFLKEGEQTDARRARISHKFPKDCNRYRIKRNDKERPFPMHAFRRIGSGKSHHFNVLIKNGIVRYAVAATLRTLPMNMASEGFRRGLRNRASSITIEKRPEGGVKITES